MLRRRKTNLLKYFELRVGRCAGYRGNWKTFQNLCCRCQWLQGQVVIVDIHVACI